MKNKIPDGDVKLANDIYDYPGSYENFRKSKTCKFCNRVVKFSFSLKSNRKNPELGGLYHVCPECGKEEKYIGENFKRK